MKLEKFNPAAHIKRTSFMKFGAESESFLLYEAPQWSINAVVTNEHVKARNGALPANQTREEPVSADYDAALLAIGESRDKEAFVVLFEHFAPRVKSFLMKGGLQPEMADELAQETMLTVWNKAENYNPAKAKASTWIFTIARNKKIDSFRKSSNENIVDLELSLFKDDSPGPGEQTIQAQEAEAIAKALETLPEDQADLIHKSFFEGKSHSEIAKETKIPLGTIKSRIRLALERLRGEDSVKDLK